ncbi:MAG: glycosyltransferase [Methanoregula sp.]|nr:glycosyltransferase [Methanoregula sp.]
MSIDTGHYETLFQDTHGKRAEETGYVREILKLVEASKDVTFHSREIVDVIVPVYNAYEDLCRCLQSLLKYQDIYRIVLINDCSTDERIYSLLVKIQKIDTSRIKIINPPENQGFVKSVNTGMRFSTNDVILLNSDTIVTGNWAKKLRDCAYLKKNIATVTPFTNNGTICSIPEFCKNNQIPPGFSLDSFGKFVEDLSFGQYPEIPTAVGFCMYIKREVLDTIGIFDEISFGKGYCEENDFCMRAIKAGYSNRLCDNTYIYHVGERSFSQTRNERIEKNMKILSSRYPDYLPLVTKFCEENPLSDQQEYIKINLETGKNNGNKKRILYVLHHLGGGTDKHVEDLITSLHQHYIFFIAQVIDNDLTFTEINDGSRRKYRFPMRAFTAHTKSNPEYSEIMRKGIVSFKIDLIHIHHLLGHSFDIFQIGRDLEVPILYTIHDYFCICPKINLLNETGQYCNTPDLPVCISCLSNSYGYPKEYITTWRSVFHEGFGWCNHIIAPSKTAIEITGHYFPEIKQKYSVIEHGHSIKKIDQLGNISNNSVRFHIAYIGILARHKGRDVFFNLAKSKELSDITTWSVIGTTDDGRGAGYYPDLNITVTGPYSDFDQLTDIVYRNKVDLIVLPAIWPETFSFALSEAWCLGLPVLGSNLGAIQERIADTGGGWTADMSDINCVKSKILAIIHSKDDYLTVKNKIKTIRLTSLVSAADHYNHIYQKNVMPHKVDCAFTFSNREIYNSMKCGLSQDITLGTPTNSFMNNAPDTNNVCKKFLLCLQENGIKYTVKRVLIYLTKPVRISSGKKM